MDNPVDFNETAISDEIDAMATECSEANWDGYGALPISHKAVEFAKSFIKELPPPFSNPEISPEPDGSIGLEWHVRNDNWIIISFNGDGEFYFASQKDPKTKFDGQGVLDDSQIQFLLETLKMIVTPSDM